MLNLIEILFLIFGWIYNIRSLIISSLVVSVVFMIGSFILMGYDNDYEGWGLSLFVQIVCFVLSIVKLCI